MILEVRSTESIKPLHIWSPKTGCGRIDTTGKQRKMERRWESNPNGRLSEAHKMRRFVIHRSLRAIGVRIFAL
jgi:hypothetical protein